MSLSIESNILLSICIPAYNRPSDLNAALEAIESQYQPCIEVVISDNCSTDPCILGIISDFQQHLPIRLFKQPFNCGAEENVMRVTSYACGEYLLIHGSDDRLADGALECIIQILLSKHPDLLSYGYSLGKESNSSSPRLNICPRNELQLQYPDCIKIFNHTPDLSGSFMFISSFIVRSRLWKSQDGRDQPAWIGSQYRHTCRIHQLIHSGFVKSIALYPKALIEASNTDFEPAITEYEKKLHKRSYHEIRKNSFKGSVIFYDASLMILLASTVYSSWHSFPRGLLVNYRRAYPARKLLKEAVLYGQAFIVEYCELIKPIPLGSAYNLRLGAVRHLANAPILLSMSMNVLKLISQCKTLVALILSSLQSKR